MCPSLCPCCGSNKCTLNISVRLCKCWSQLGIMSSVLASINAYIYAFIFIYMRMRMGCRCFAHVLRILILICTTLRLTKHTFATNVCAFNLSGPSDMLQLVQLSADDAVRFPDPAGMVFTCWTDPSLLGCTKSSDARRQDAEEMTLHLSWPALYHSTSLMTRNLHVTCR